MHWPGPGSLAPHPRPAYLRASPAAVDPAAAAGRAPHPAAKPRTQAQPSGRQPGPGAERTPPASVLTPSPRK